MSERGKTWLRDYKWQKLTGIILIAGLLFVDDPLFMYVSALPLLILLFSRYILGADELRKSIRVGSILVASIAAMYIFRVILFALTPIKLYKHQPGALDPVGIMTNIEHLLVGGLRVVGISTDIQARAQSIYVAVSIALLVGAIVGIFLSLKKYPKSLFFQYLAFIFFWNCVVVATLGPGVSEEAAISRYFIILPVVEIIGLILLITHIRLKRQFVVLASLLVLLLIVTTVLVGKTFHQPRIDSQDSQKAVDIIKSQNLEKGYTDYGDANVNTYLSDYKTLYLPATCFTKPNAQQELRYYDLLSEKGVKENKKVTRSFYLYFGEGNINCNPSSLTAQLGIPDKTISFSLKYSTTLGHIAIYNYDISSKLPDQMQE